MQDYDEHNEDLDEIDEHKPHYFCKLTFGQFFTLMVLEIVTLSFVFYLGARYGNEYLKLDVLTESKREPVSIVSDVPLRPKKVEAVRTEETELQGMARDALKSGKIDLKKRVEEILAREQGPTVPPMGEPSYDESQQEPYIYGGQQPQPAAQPEFDYQQLQEQLAAQRAQQQEISAEADELPQGVVKIKSAESAQFSVQVGAYPDVKEASYRVEEWKAKGYPAYMMIANLGEKGQWYRVRIGAFPDQENADIYLGDLKGKEGIADAYVVRNEQ